MPNVLAKLPRSLTTLGTVACGAAGARDEGVDARRDARLAARIAFSPLLCPPSFLDFLFCRAFK